MSPSFHKAVVSLDSNDAPPSPRMDEAAVIGNASSTVVAGNASEVGRHVFIEEAADVIDESDVIKAKSTKSTKSKKSRKRSARSEASTAGKSNIGGEGCQFDYPARLAFLAHRDCQPDFSDPQNCKIGNVRRRKLGTGRTETLDNESDGSQRAKIGRLRYLIGLTVNSMYCQVCVLLLIGFDCVLTVIEFTLDDDGKEEVKGTYFVCNLIVLSLLGAEVLGRLYYLSLPFFRSPLNVFELMLIPLGIAELTVLENVKASLLRALRPVFRGLRILRILVKSAGRGHAFWRSIRRRVAGNRVRFDSDGFDLDLVYIKRHLIVTSLPAVGVEALFRNPAREVARFLNERHPNRYLLINLTDQCDYPLECFFGRYIQIPIDQYGVPSMQTLWETCILMRDYVRIHPDHVVCIHSRNGCGRVAMVTIAWLLLNGSFPNSGSAIAHFEQCRVDELDEQGDIQSFDTASQLRFVDYFAEMMRHKEKYGDERVEELLQEPRGVRLKQIRIHGLVGNFSDTAHVRCFLHSDNVELSQTQSGNVSGAEASHPLSSKGSNDRKTMHSTASIFGHLSSLATLKSAASKIGVQRGEKRLGIMQQVRLEIEKATGEAIVAGVKAREDTPWLDTDPCDVGDITITETRDELVRFAIKDCDQTHGELNFELSILPPPERAISKRVKGVGNIFSSLIRAVACCGRRYESGTSEENQGFLSAKKLLCSFWLHTNFLETDAKESHNLFAGMQDDTRGVMVSVGLKRFDLDKGAGAPKLSSYSVSMEVLLDFEVERHFVRELDGEAESSSGSEENEDEHRNDVHGLETMRNIRLGWVNWMIKAVWPYAEPTARNFINEFIEPMLESSLPSMLKPVKVKELKFPRDYPPRVGPMSGTRRNHSHDHDGLELQLDVHLNYDTGLTVLIDVGNMAEVGISHMKVNGQLSIRMSPFIEEIPIIGGVQVFFLNLPEVHLTFAGHIDFANISMIKKAIIEAVKGALLKKIVLPNMIMLDTTRYGMKRGQLIQFGDCAPHAVLRLKVEKAEKLRAADWGFFKEGSSDPYCEVRLGPERYKTQVCKRNVNPEWNETFDFLLYDWNQTLSITIFDHDFAKTDDILGRIKALPVLKVLESPDDWIPLQEEEEKPHKANSNGSVKLSAEVFHLKHDEKSLRALSKVIKEAEKAMPVEDTPVELNPSKSPSDWMSCNPTCDGGGCNPCDAREGSSVGLLFAEKSEERDQHAEEEVLKIANAPDDENGRGLLARQASANTVISTFTSSSEQDKPIGALFIFKVMGALIPTSIAQHVESVSIQVSMGSAVTTRALSPKEYKGLDRVPDDVKEIVQGLAKNTNLSANDIKKSVHVDDVLVERVIEKALGYNGEIAKSRMYLQVTPQDIVAAQRKISLAVLVKEKKVEERVFGLGMFDEHNLHFRKTLEVPETKLSRSETAKKTTSHAKEKKEVIKLDLDASLLILRRYSASAVEDVVKRHKDRPR